MLQVTCLGNCDMMKQMSAHLCSSSRVTGHHVADLRSCMVGVLSPSHLQLLDNMLQRVETIAEAAASKVLTLNRHMFVCNFLTAASCCHPAGMSSAETQLQILCALLCHASMITVTPIQERCLLQGNVRVLIDAEHSYMQPAIDAVVLHLQAKYNKHTAIVYNTYQCYLKDAHPRLTADMQLAKNKGFLLAAKVVRGAYMQLERDRAAQLGYPSPIQDTLQDTHDNYNRSVPLNSPRDIIQSRSSKAARPKLS